MPQKIGALVAGVALMGAGIADLFVSRHLTIAGDLALIAAGCGALGYHVTLQ